MKNKFVIHQLSLLSIGGIQSTFKFYSAIANEKSEFNHIIFTNNKVDNQYNKELKIQIKSLKNPINLILFCYHLNSKNSVVNFYNNLSSKKINFLFKIIPVSNIIFHERGNVWNIKSDKTKIYEFNAEKAYKIIANSKASKTMLVKKFGLKSTKINVIYNGVLNKIYNVKKIHGNKINIGFIGRLDTNKGVNIFIETAKRLKDFQFNIAGVGPLESYVKEQIKNIKNITFHGRIENPYKFLKNQDLLIVPSIREPYGNVIIEAGVMKVPVIASKVDGIPEIIKHGIRGILIEPSEVLDENLIQEKALPYPEFVVSHKRTLVKPKQINPDQLAKEISLLLSNKDKMNLLAENLYSFVKTNNTVKKYFESLERVFDKILKDK